MSCTIVDDGVKTETMIWIDEIAILISIAMSNDQQTNGDSRGNRAS